MKKALIKKLGIIGLSFAATLATAFGVAFTNTAVTAETANLAELRVSGATVNGNTVDGTSGSAYSGEIAYVLEGDSAVNFSFTEQTSKWINSDYAINYTFTVCDATEEPVFDVVYKGDGQVATQAYVRYGDQIRSRTSHIEADPWYSADGFYFYNQVPQYAFGYAAPSLFQQSKYGSTGTLEIKFVDDVVQVWYSYGRDPKGQMLLAAFDGTDEGFDTTARRETGMSENGWGLPKINDKLANGYIIKFATNNVGSNGTETYDIDVTFNSITAETKTYKPKTDLTENLAAAIGATVEGNTVNGETGKGYQGEIPYTLTGNTSLNFTFSDIGGGSWISDGYALNFVYSICDMSNNTVFQVVYKGDNTATQAYVKYGDQIRTNVKHINADPWYNASGYYYYNQVPIWMYGYFQPCLFTKSSDTGTLDIKFVDDVVQVWATYNGGGQWLIAQFDGSDEGFTAPTGRVAAENFTAWGLPKIADQLKDGYKIKYETTNVSNNSTQFDIDVTFNSLKTGTATPNNGIARMTEIPKTIVTDGNATAAWGTDSMGNEGMVIDGAAKTSYTAAIPGYMQGGTTLKIAFPNTRTVWDEGTNWQKASFVVNDLVGEEVFRVVYTLAGGMYTRVEVEYGTESRTHSSQIDGNWHEGYVFNNYYSSSDCQNMAPGLGASNQARIAANLQIQINGDVVSVWAYDATTARMYEIAAFDGTNVAYAQASDNGALRISAADFQGWNLPKIYDRVKDGYTIEVQGTCQNTDKHEIDVTVLSVDTANYFNTVTVDGVAEKVAFNGEYTLPQATATAGKVFLGWKNVATNELYRAGEAFENITANMAFEAVELTFGMNGASMRIDTATEENTSGLRFITTYNEAEMQAVSAYVKSMGTLILKTSSLTDKEFVIENFTVGTDIAKVVNTKEHYDASEGVKAYAAALINIKPENVNQAFSARAYLEVEYHDGTTALVYSAYSAENNSRSIVGVAQALREIESYYGALSAEAQAVIDFYADYNA